MTDDKMVQVVQRGLRVAVHMRYNATEDGGIIF